MNEKIIRIVFWNIVSNIITAFIFWVLHMFDKMGLGLIIIALYFVVMAFITTYLVYGIESGNKIKGFIMFIFGRTKPLYKYDKTIYKIVGTILKLKALGGEEVRPVTLEKISQLLQINGEIIKGHLLDMCDKYLIACHISEGKSIYNKSKIILTKKAFNDKVLINRAVQYILKNS
jgi:hypothetical protein